MTHVRLRIRSVSGATQAPSRAALLRWMVVLLFAAPIVPLLLWSVADVWRWPSLWPSTWSASAWQSVLDPGGRALSALTDSLAVSGLSALVSMAIALPAGRALAEPWRGRSAVRALVVGPALVPPIAVAMGLQTAFARVGLVDTIPAVAASHLVPTLPYATLLTAAAFGRLSPAWDDLARSLGAGRWSRWWRVTAPMLAPTIGLATSFAFLVSWSQYLFTLLVGGGRVVTLPLQLYAYVGAGEHARAAAIACVFIAPPMLLLALLGRSLAEDDLAVGASAAEAGG